LLARLDSIKWKKPKKGPVAEGEKDYDEVTKEYSLCKEYLKDSFLAKIMG
jgi:hypothetical protein